jgi:hypothetical protein
LELMLSCVPFSYAHVKPCATEPSFDQEDAEDPKYVILDNECFNDNEGVMSLPTMKNSC